MNPIHFLSSNSKFVLLIRHRYLQRLALTPSFLRDFRKSSIQSHTVAYSNQDGGSSTRQTHTYKINHSSGEVRRSKNHRWSERSQRVPRSLAALSRSLIPRKERRRSSSFSFFFSSFLQMGAEVEKTTGKRIFPRSRCIFFLSVDGGTPARNFVNGISS